MYHTLRFIEIHLLSTYDWFYISQDETFTNGFLLQDFVSHLSPGPEIYIGKPMEFIGGQEGWRYCHGGSGYLVSRALFLSLGPHLDICRSDILSSRPDEWLGRCLQDTLSISCVAEFQSEIRNLSSFTPDGDSNLLWPIGVNPPFNPTSRFDLLTWEYFTEMHTFSCPDGSPKCLLQGVWLLDVQQVLEEALDQLNQRYLPWLHFRKRRLLNGYRRFDPTRGMEYTLDLLLEATTEKGHVGVITKRLSLLRPLGFVEILPMPYVTEATRVQLVLPLMPYDIDHIAGFLDVFATNLLDPQENVALTVLLVYDMGSSGQEKDMYEDVRTMLAELEKRYTYLRLEVSSVRTELASQVRLMEVVSKKHSTDTLFFLVSVWSEVTSEALNRCRMNAIGAWQVFSPVHYQEYSSDVSRPGFSIPQSAEFPHDGHFDRLSSSEFCFYNSDFMRASNRMAAEVQKEEDEDDGDIELLELFLQHSDLHVFRALEPALVQRFSRRKCSTHLSGDGYHRCVQSNLEGLGSRIHLAMALFDQDQTNST
ncbi:hypothetical protein GDO81_023407 [Engystomops pustulosus]|uniref:Hexosyltransferase n=1 Tax=Engystomops pustulosus TaxID=76066 RepID=A0AAV6Z439_ENGPU|nr:hypothetical protein GDO81_023407 [Engystomops pustulosus]